MALNKSPFTGQMSVYAWIAQQDHDTRIVTIPVRYVEMVGANAAALLAQATWWCDQVGNPKRRFYHSQIQWQEELYMTRQEVRTAIRKLVAAGVIRLEVASVPGHAEKTTWYEVDFQKIMEWWKETDSI